MKSVLLPRKRKTDEMRKHYKNDKIKFYIAMFVIQSVKNAMHGVNISFTLLALKQYLPVNSFPLEAVKTNNLVQIMF